ncbi:MAG: transferase protein [Acidobacteria bacterium]|nr:transferase protein [Acidobacteriota bacterium]
MKCILLAAGYATRLYPLTQNLPKSLLPIGESTILDLIIRQIEQVESIDHIFIVTNDRFFHLFEDWRSRQQIRQKITVLNDGTTTNDNRIGAIADLRFAIETGSVAEDILVLAGDNLFDFSLTDFIRFFERVDRDCITAHTLSELAALQRTGVIEVDAHDRVTGFEEKPHCPRSNLAVPPFYIFQQETLPLIRQYLAAGNNPDAPGNFIPWLIERREVYAFRFQGQRYDIGTMASYQQAIQIFAGKEEH